MSDSASTERPAEKKDRSHYLYMAVIAAVIAGIAVGFLAPEVGKALKPLGTGFVNLIKMMIGPIIFCTIVLGIGSVRKASQVGKVGGLALALLHRDVDVRLVSGCWSATSSTPARACNSPAPSGRGLAGGRRRRPTSADFLLGHHPDHAVLRR